MALAFIKSLFQHCLSTMLERKSFSDAPRASMSEASFSAVDHNLEAVEVWGMSTGPELCMRLAVAIRIDQVLFVDVVTGHHHCRIPQVRPLFGIHARSAFPFSGRV